MQVNTHVGVRVYALHPSTSNHTYTSNIGKSRCVFQRKFRGPCVQNIALAHIMTRAGIFPPKYEKAGTPAIAGSLASLYICCNQCLKVSHQSG